MGQTVTLLSQDFEGSNPSPPTTNIIPQSISTQNHLSNPASFSPLDLLRYS